MTYAFAARWLAASVRRPSVTVSAVAVMETPFGELWGA